LETNITGDVWVASDASKPLLPRSFLICTIVKRFCLSILGCFAQPALLCSIKNVYCFSVKLGTMSLATQDISLNVPF